MHTSGTTNQPKGAMLAHSNFISGIAHSDFIGFDLNDEDTYLSYVPLSHIQEQAILTTSIVHGFRFGFLTPTKQDDQPEVISKMMIEDLQTLKPTVFGSFPLFYNKIMKAILSKIEQQSSVHVKWMFEKAVKAKLENLHSTGELTHSIYDKMVF
jgi:long-chain acyl-CoA synthetase